jgi:hypothetical protein
VTCGAAECKKAHNRARCYSYQKQKAEEFAVRGESYRGQWGREYYGNGKQRAGGGDAIRRVALGNRDNWICGLCRGSIDPHLRHPDLESGSIDHITPLGPKHNGKHTWDNVQIAHYRCNIRKKDRLNWSPEEATSGNP